ncbi:hypothetical protein [Paraburkholderia sacchari]|uniref:hypothetical protein n=1 Tax=Paraburkholderia sacchari TaxID=159450 RepID=UPI001BCFC47D|nr:hypothetical protein [Paraburkholderia sacchari]
MGAVLMEYLGDEPLTLDDVMAQCRLDDASELERELIETTWIPAARQAAETRTGSAIRPGVYRERLASFPVGHFALALGQVNKIRSVEWRSADGAVGELEDSAFELIHMGNESLIASSSDAAWPLAAAVTLTYEAGIDIARFPSVRHWLLLTVGWAYEQRELYNVGQAIESMPTDYTDSLLAPIRVPPRF